jgi:hypothetical protein
MRSEATAQIGDRVSFRIADVFLPEPPEVLAKLTPDTETNGVVVEFSDSGNNRSHYRAAIGTAAGERFACA